MRSPSRSATDTSATAVMTHADEVAELRTSLVESAGAAARGLRESALHGVSVPHPWAAYVEKVRHASYRIADKDIEMVLAACGSEDAVFEMTLAAAVGAATDCLDAGLRALRQAG